MQTVRSMLPTLFAALASSALACGSPAIDTSHSPIAAAGDPQSTGGSAGEQAGDPSTGGGAGEQAGDPSTGGSAGEQAGNPSTGGSAGWAATGGKAGTGGSVTSRDAGVDARSAAGSSGGAAGASAPGPRDATQYPGLYVDGSALFDRCGARVVLRGINKMAVYEDRQGTSFAEIAKTGANAVRFMWMTAVAASEMDQTLAAAAAAHLVAMPELHDATGDFSKMSAVETFWTSPGAVAVIKKYAPQLIVNIANEAGQDVDDNTYTTTYTRIVSHMRQVGIHVPLVIDAAGWGRNVEQLLKLAPAIQSQDPDRNLIFSWHEYDSGASETSRITKSFEGANKAGLALMVGEFANVGSGACGTPIPYQFLLAEAARLQIGLFPWSWDNMNGDCKTGGGQSPFDMTTDGIHMSTLRPGWATEVATTDPNSIKNTSVVPKSLSTGSCTP